MLAAGDVSVAIVPVNARLTWIVTTGRVAEWATHWSVAAAAVMMSVDRGVEKNRPKLDGPRPGYSVRPTRPASAGSRGGLRSGPSRPRVVSPIESCQAVQVVDADVNAPNRYEATGPAKVRPPVVVRTSSGTTPSTLLSRNR